MVDIKAGDEMDIELIEEAVVPTVIDEDITEIENDQLEDFASDEKDEPASGSYEQDFTNYEEEVELLENESYYEDMQYMEPEGIEQQELELQNF